VTTGKLFQMLTIHVQWRMKNEQCNWNVVCTVYIDPSLSCCRLGNYLVVLFLISKIVYIGNAVGQLFLLDLVLATKYHTLGFDVTNNLARRIDWTEQSYVAFPRVTLCDFKVTYFTKRFTFLPDHTAIEYHQLLASWCCLSVSPSVRL